jgi:acrylyl-CoA reductase (NADPH)
MPYFGYVVKANSENKFSGAYEEINKPEIQDQEVLIKTHYSSLNYKDALAATGVKGVVKEYPFIPGIDVAGEVMESNSEYFSVGDLVLATGYKLGMSINGGFGQLVALPSNWIVKLPDGLSLLSAMEIGTAGLTAAASVKKLLDNEISLDKPVLVSGVTGGVGSIAVKLLQHLDIEVHGISGKSSDDEIIKSLSLTKLISRSKFMDEPTKPLNKALYAGAIDTVGGEMLAKMISKIELEGSVSCCGNVGGMNFTSSVFPFILRGISLFGIDSAESKIELKKELWERLATDWKLDLSKNSRVISIEKIDEYIVKILDGSHSGRTVIKHGE